MFIHANPFFIVLILLSPPSSILLISPLHQLQRNSLVFLGLFAPLFQAVFFLSSCPSLFHRLTSVRRQQCVLFNRWKARGQRWPIEETPGLAGTEGGLWRERDGVCGHGSMHQTGSFRSMASLFIHWSLLCKCLSMSGLAEMMVLALKVQFTAFNRHRLTCVQIFFICVTP